VPASLLDPVRPAFRAAATTFIPETASAEPAVWDRLEMIIEQALSQRPAGLRRRIVMFVRMLDFLALARHGTRLAGLDPEQRTRFLEGLSASRVGLIRRGVWGLRTLVQMGWYGQPEVQREIGYRASPAGWEARR
jgi:hypothetical protein